MNDESNDCRCHDCPEVSDAPVPPLELEVCPQTDCVCPGGTGSTSPKCLEDLIAEQAKQIAKADQAKAFKTAVEDLLGKAKTASQEYNLDKYKELCDKWQMQDKAIADLIDKLICAVSCWQCVIECHVCPLINDICNAETSLYSDTALSPGTHKLSNRHDHRYLLWRDAEKKRRRFERIAEVLKAWVSPAKTIEKNLTDNQALIKDATALLGSAAPKAVYTVFLRLLPMHLAIKPPTATTAIDLKKYGCDTVFCACDTGQEDHCCGINVGLPSVRERLIGTQPHLIAPNKYLDLICCLVTCRYVTAKDQHASASAELDKADNEIASALKMIGDDRLKSLDKDASAAVPSVVDCANYKSPGASTQAY